VTQSIEVLRDSDPRCAELEANGYTLVAESWGARLRFNEDVDFSIFRQATSKVREKGIHIQELSSEFADELLIVELANNADYPNTPATFHALPTIESMRALWREGNRIFGATDGDLLIGAISTSRREDFVELDFASILREYRGMGIGKALASVAILTWIETGIHIFATGGAMTNEASLGTVRSLGFSVEEKWRSYQINS